MAEALQNVVNVAAQAAASAALSLEALAKAKEDKRTCLIHLGQTWGTWKLTKPG